jgi:hypothetical protein
MNDPNEIYYKKQRLRKLKKNAVNIIKDIFSKYQITDFSIAESDLKISEDTNGKKDIIWNNNFDNNFSEIKSDDLLKDYQLSKIKDRKDDKGIFYHFLRYDYAKILFSTGKIQLSSLNQYLQSDYKEYIEFFHRYLEVRDYSGFLDMRKNKTFIFCLTDSFRNEYFWDKFADQDKGIALGIRFKSFTEDSDLKDYYHFRNIFYDTGNALEFVSEIKKTIKLVLNFEFKIRLNNVPFAYYYKRDEYQIENETRLCFDFNFFEARKEIYKNFTSKIPDRQRLDNILHILNDDEDRDYIEIDLNGNDFFKAEITDIICDKNLSTKEINNLNYIKHFPKAYCWQRV